MPQFDFLVIGSGIAGLSYAAKLARHFDAKKEQVSIAVITKVQADETNTKSTNPLHAAKKPITRKNRHFWQWPKKRRGGSA